MHGAVPLHREREKIRKLMGGELMSEFVIK